MKFTANIEVSWSIIAFKLQLIRGHHDLSHDVVHEDLNLPDLFDLRGRWHGSVGASGGGDGDTLVKTHYCLYYYYMELA